MARAPAGHEMRSCTFGARCRSANGARDRSATESDSRDVALPGSRADHANRNLHRGSPRHQLLDNTALLPAIVWTTILVLATWPLQLDWPCRSATYLGTNELGVIGHGLLHLPRGQRLPHRRSSNARKSRCRAGDAASFRMSANDRPAGLDVRGHAPEHQAFSSSLTVPAPRRIRRGGDGGPAWRAHDDSGSSPPGLPVTAMARRTARPKTIREIIERGLELPFYGPCQVGQNPSRSAGAC
jgi:hypothetical protein